MIWSVRTNVVNLTYKRHSMYVKDESYSDVYNLHILLLVFGKQWYITGTSFR